MNIGAESLESDLLRCTQIGVGANDGSKSSASDRSMSAHVGAGKSAMPDQLASAKSP
jgi:hypothetical protein